MPVSRGGQARHDLPQVVDRLRRPPPGKAPRQAPAISRHHDTGSTCAIVHPESTFGSGTDMTINKPYRPSSKAPFHLNDQAGLIPDENPRLRLPTAPLRGGLRPTLTLETTAAPGGRNQRSGPAPASAQYPATATLSVEGNAEAVIYQHCCNDPLNPDKSWIQAANLQSATRRGSASP